MATPPRRGIGLSWSLRSSGSSSRPAPCAASRTTGVSRYAATTATPKAASEISTPAGSAFDLVEDAKQAAPRSDLVDVVRSQRPVRLGQVAVVVDDPGGQPLAHGDRPEAG